MFKSIKVALLAIVGLAFTATAYADFTFVSWGGAYTMSQQKAYIDTWDDRKNGISVENYNGGLGEIRAQVESGNVIWDVVDILPSDAIAGCDEGLFEELDWSTFPEAPGGVSYVDSIPENGTGASGPISACAAPQIWWTYVVFFDPSAFPGKKPKRIKDFYDTKKFPGKRGIHTWASANLEMALVADGVKANKVYDVLSTPEGVDRAFAKLDTIKDDVVFWSAGAQPLELVKSGEVVMSIAYNGRVGAAKLSEGANFDYIWEGQVLEGDWIAIVKGSPNKDEAIEFLKHATTCEAQAGQAKYITYGPLRTCGLDIIKKNEPWFHTGVNVLEHMPNTKKKVKRSVFANPQFWADNGTEIGERFSAWMGK